MVKYYNIQRTTNFEFRDLAGQPVRRKWQQVLVSCLAGTALVHPLARLLSTLDWRADLLSHFGEPALGVTLLAIAVVLRRCPRLAVGLACLAVFQAAALLRYERTNPVPPDPRSNERLRVLMANVMADNADYEDLARLIQRERPDVVGLVEYTPLWRSGLRAVREEFPYRMEAPGGGDGLALWFREPPLTMEPAECLEPGAWPVLHATFRFAGRTRHLWLVHPRSPLKREAMRPGNPELAALAERVRDTKGSRAVVGDLNTTDGSGNFAAFLRETGLRDGRLGFGRQGSFPTHSIYRIAIDHALVSPDLAVTDRRLGPPIGSDHFPLILELAPAAEADSETKTATHDRQASD